MDGWMDGWMGGWMDGWMDGGCCSGFSRSRLSVDFPSVVDGWFD